MQSFAAVLALSLAVAVPFAASAKPKAAAVSGGALSATPVACPATDPVVWVNTSSKIYWVAGSEFYGKTKHGGYGCTSAAVAMGARAPKASPVGHKGSAMMTGTPVTPAPEAGAMSAATGKKKHHHKGAAMASPSPAP